ncbi:DUF4251 domain-containing protein [Riemerella anatipestifer]|uniref:DUF4251 domain-containing protein n=1 Tax=Riemerella anatipestifer TaxID=34085 RepID=UPI002866EA42|nr:DUF4251 domain-containing protein [Riemerella anatipestifer]MDR7793612.1 DUF4251 domain-containing protein [Riemerella anatipestifer]
MKRVIILLLTGLSLISCQTQYGINENKVQSYIDKNEFTVMAKRALPNNYDVINIAQSFPTVGSRMFELDYGYAVTLKKDSLSVNLPYFGRMFNTSLDPSKNSFNTETKDFKLSKNKTKKGYTYHFSLSHPENMSDIYIDILKNGKAYISINSRDRQPISYDGYLVEQP